MKAIHYRHIVIPRDVVAAAIVPSAKIVYGVLLMFKGDKDYCFPSYGNIAKLAHMTKRNVIFCVHELEQHGFVRVEHGRLRRSNQYWFPGSSGIKQVK